MPVHVSDRLATLARPGIGTGPGRLGRATAADALGALAPGCGSGLSGHRPPPVKPYYLAWLDSPGRAKAIGPTQFPIVPAIAPGNPVQGFAFLDDVRAPVHRRVIKMVVEYGAGITAWKHQNKEERPEKRQTGAHSGRVTMRTGSGNRGGSVSQRCLAAA